MSCWGRVAQFAEIFAHNYWMSWRRGGDNSYYDNRKGSWEEIQKSLSDGVFERGKYFELRQKQKQTVSMLHSSKRSAQCAKTEQLKEKKKNVASGQKGQPIFCTNFVMGPSVLPVLWEVAHIINLVSSVFCCHMLRDWGCAE